MRKNVAFTPFSFSTSRIFGVHSGSGPSSKVMAILLGELPYMLTSYGDGMVLEDLVADQVVGIDLDLALAGSRARVNAQDFALAFDVHVLAGRNGLELGRRVGFVRPVPHRPQRTVLGAQPPQRKGVDAQGVGAAHLVQAR